MTIGIKQELLDRLERFEEFLNKLANSESYPVFARQSKQILEQAK